ncbi:MAG: dicarboxylate/amino acid:cation symporter [Rikenellaceae bacterium]|nr:dicarboxylate/amino acid:cation symporter [Rikenellaceae bacterium]
MKKLLKNLGLWIIIAMVVGIIVGVFMGPEASMFKPLGDLFIQLIKMLVVPLVLVSIISGASALGETKSAGLIGGLSIGFMIVTTVISIVIALILGEIFQPGASISQTTVATIVEGYESTPSEAAPAMGFWDTVIGMIPANPIEALTRGDILQIIIFGLFLGFGISALSSEKRQRISSGLNIILDALIWCIGKVMLVAPFGVFGLIADATGTFGFDILLQVANVLWIDIIAVLIIGLGLYPLCISLFSRVKLKDYFRAMVKPQVVSFSTASSLATLPVNMNACDEMGISKQTSGFVLPLGATINMAGNAIYYALLAVFFAQFYGIDLTIADYTSITLVCSLGAIGQAGVPGPTLLAAAVLVAADIPLEGLPLFYALDRIFDMIRTTLNITGDAACAAVVDRFARK